MVPILGIGAAAGLVSALLFAVVTTGNPLAVLLYLVAPLPILLAALGWNHVAGLAAAVVGGLVIGFVYSFKAGLTFAIGVALPAWWFAYLALLARDENGHVEWYPLGRLLLWMAIASAVLTTMGAIAIGGTYEALERSFTRAVQALEIINPRAFEGLTEEARARSVKDLGALFAKLAPPISAAVGVGTSVILLWLAGRITRASARLPRPWPFIPGATMPRVALGILAAATALGLVLDGFPGLSARSLAASLIMAFCFQGLATLHVITQGVGARSGILSGVYLIFVLIPIWPAVLIAMIGVADALFGFRARRAPGPAVPPAAPLT